jgi:hypothetical protein
MERKRKPKRADSDDYLKHWKPNPSAKTDPDDLEGRQRRNENYDRLADEYIIPSFSTILLILTIAKLLRQLHRLLPRRMGPVFPLLPISARSRADAPSDGSP